MRELEKILEEIKDVLKDTYLDIANNYDVSDLRYDSDKVACVAGKFRCVASERIEAIVRKHMSGKDKDVLANNGWIPVEKEWPPFGQRFQATILHHEWVSDYDSSWVPDEEKVYHPAYTEVCEIYPMGALWCYNCTEDDYHSDVVYIAPAKDMGGPVAEIVAWRLLPEPYHPEPKLCDKRL